MKRKITALTITLSESAARLADVAATARDIRSRHIARQDQEFTLTPEDYQALGGQVCSRVTLING
jgi:hypothetical protein